MPLLASSASVKVGCARDDDEIELRQVVRIILCIRGGEYSRMRQPPWLFLLRCMCHTAIRINIR